MIVKLVVLGIIFKKIDDKTLILTQKRKVINHDYDPLYNDTWEGVGETVEEGETVLEALLRGCQEELGAPNFSPLKIIGAKNEEYSTRPEDKIASFNPVACLHQLKRPQPWFALLFLVEVSPDFEPDLKQEKEGEVGGYHWWKPEELEKEMEEHPENFMGLHYPGFLRMIDFLKK